MTKKNTILFLFIVLFLCACTKKIAHSSYEKSLTSNEEQTKELKKNNNNYEPTNILGHYSLNSKDIDKIDRPKPHAAHKSRSNNNSQSNQAVLNDHEFRDFSKVTKYTPDIQENYNLSNKQVIKIERENRRNTYTKTRPPGQKTLDSREYNQLFPINY